MRLKEDVEKRGYFWLSSAPERKIPGTLIVSDGGNICVEVLGLFDDSVNGLNKVLSGKLTMERIIGEVETYGLVTLENCFYKKTNISLGGISKSLVHVNRVLLGVAYKENEPVLFNEFRFSVEGIDEWVGISGINVSNNYEAKSSIIAYQPPQDIVIDLNNGMQLKIGFTWSLPGFPVQREAKITQKIFFELISMNEIPLDDFVSTAFQIVTLMCFAIDETVCLEKVSATSNSLMQDMGNGVFAPISIEIIYASLPFDEKEPKTERFRMLFRYGQIKENSERVFNNWIAAYETIEPALNLYFSVRTGTHQYLEGKFLALAQCLETLHRRTSAGKLMEQVQYEILKEGIISHCPDEHQAWLMGRLMHGNEVNLSSRLKDILRPFKRYIGASKDLSKLTQSIVQTRNYLTHYDESNLHNVVKGRNLWPLCLKMEAIFQLHLLKTLGFTPDEIELVYKNSDDLQRKLQES